MDVRQSGRRSGLGIGPGAAQTGATLVTLGAIGEPARATVLANVLALPLFTLGMCMTMIGIRHRRRRSAVRHCPVEAPSDAPGPILRRINVFLCRCSWWSMALADAACWVLVEVVLRSGPHGRASPLGSFPVDFVFAQSLATAYIAIAALFLVLPSAIVPLCPMGPARAASPASRTVVLLADLRIPPGIRSGPRARTRALGCSA